MALFHYHDTTAVRGQHQLLARKIFKMEFIIIFKNITKCNIFLSTFSCKNYRKFADHNLEKLCPRFLALASTIPVLGLERVCPRKVGPWPRIFLSPWPWLRTLCPRLHLCLSILCQIVRNDLYYCIVKPFACWCF